MHWSFRDDWDDDTDRDIGRTNNGGFLPYLPRGEKRDVGCTRIAQASMRLGRRITSLDDVPLGTSIRYLIYVHIYATRPLSVNIILSMFDTSLSPPLCQVYIDINERILNRKLKQI